MALPDLKLEGSSGSSSSSLRQGGHTQNAKDVAIGGLATVLAVTKEASAPFPPLQGVVGGILAIKDVLENVSSNAHDIDALTDYMEKLKSMIEMSMPENYDSCPKALQLRLDDLERDINVISKEIENLRSQGRITRVFTTKATSGKIQEHVRALMWAIHKFIVGGTIEMEMAVDELHAAVQEGFERIIARFDGLDLRVQNLGGRTELGDNFPFLWRAKSARFDCNMNHDVCEKETRLETLATVYHWIKPRDPYLTELTTDLIQQPTERRVLWLEGPAGTGKSTIAQTVATWCDSDNVKYLGASFFCARDSNECSNVQLVFPTIAYQLCCRIDSFKEQVAGVLRADPDIQNASVSRQLQKLIAEPLRAVKSSGTFPACAVIIDALDECKDDQATSVILKALAHYVHDLDPLKFFITSRPVQHITGGFGMAELKDNTQHLAMNSIPPEITTRDITQYLQKQLAGVAHRYDIRGSWPSDDALAALVHQANGLFIFAATTVKFIRDLRYSDPEAQLKALLCSRLPTSATSPYQFLDALYTEVLHTAFPEIDRALKARLKMVLGSIVLVQDRVSPLSLEALLGLEHDTVRKTLRQLHSLIIVPECDNDTIRLIHPSYHDFLTDRSRCADPNFVVHPKIQHSILAQHCLRTLQDLRRDICEIGDPSRLNVEIPDLDGRVAEHIPLHLQYACKHWAFHIANAEISEDIHELLKVFVAKHLLHWLEALSLLGDIGVVIEGLPLARKMLQGLPLPASDVPSLLYDCERIARQFYPCLSVSCLQVYFGVIPFCPTNISFHKQYEHEVSNVATLLSGSQHAWSPCIRIMEGHSDWVHAVAFSPNGEQIVSCADDHTIRLWDVKTGSHLHTFFGHSSWVWAVAFSPSGREIVSGSSDRTIIVWDVVTGGHLNKWSMDTRPVAIAWSPGGQFVGSGSDDYTIMIWDVTTEKCQPVSAFRGHTTGVTSLVFSHDDSLVISCDQGGTCMVRNLQDSSLTRSFSYRARALSVALSHDDKTVAVGYDDAVIALWDMEHQKFIHKLRGHKESISSVDFSRDDQILVSGSTDNTICLWSVRSGSQLVVLRGHCNGVYSARFSPDGNLICSAGSDSTIRIWEWTDYMIPAAHQTHSNASLVPWTNFRHRHDDADGPFSRVWNKLTGAYLSSSDFHFQSMRTVAFSGDGTVLATGSLEGTIHLWDTSTGARIQTLSGHNGLVTFIAFSPSGKQLSSAGGRDNTVRVWNIKKGECDRVLVGHTRYIWMVAYAHDEHTLLSCSHDGSLRRWDTLLKAKVVHSPGKVLYHNVEEKINAISVSPNKRLVLFGSYNTSQDAYGMGLLDMTTGVVVWKRKSGAGEILSLSFSSDGSRMLSGEVEGRICLWDTALALSLGDKDALLEDFHAGSKLEYVSFSVDQKSIVSDVSFHPINAREHWPHCASVNDREGSPTPPPVYVLFDDWIWRAGPAGKKRICWVPAEHRHTRWRREGVAVFGSNIAFGTDSGRMVLVDLSNCANVTELR